LCFIGVGGVLYRANEWEEANQDFDGQANPFWGVFWCALRGKYVSEKYTPQKVGHAKFSVGAPGPTGPSNGFMKKSPCQKSYLAICFPGLLGDSIPGTASIGLFSGVLLLLTIIDLGAKLRTGAPWPTGALNGINSEYTSKLLQRGTCSWSLIPYLSFVFFYSELIRTNSDVHFGLFSL